MSEITSGPAAVSALEEDSLEYQSSATDVMSAASYFAQDPTYPLKPNHSSTHNSNQMSLQELIEAELNSRLAPLQPDSLEGGIPEYHEHIRTTVINGDPTASLMDSLEASPFSLDSLVDIESGVDLPFPPNPAFGGSPPSPHSPFIHNSSSKQFKSKLTELSEIQTTINSENENNVEILGSHSLNEGNVLKSQNLIHDFRENEEILELNETTNIEAKDIAESNDIILIEEDDYIGDVEHVVVENISFEINTTSETVLESHCLQNGLSNGFEQKVERSLIDQKTVEKVLLKNDGKKLSKVSLISEERFELSCNGFSEEDFNEQKLKPVEDISETICDGNNSLDKDVSLPAYDLTVNDFHELEQPKKATTFDDFYQADSFSDFKISHFKKSESVDKSATNDQLTEIVNDKICNVDILESEDLSKDPNESNNFNQTDDTKFYNFNQSETLPMETNHKLIKDIVDLSNSYNIIDVINNKDVAVYNNSLLPADVHVTNMDETELWPEEEEEVKKEEMDEFQKMEQEVEREMEEEQKKKKKSDTDKRGKKKKKRKGESEKENKKTAYQSKDELYEKHVGPRIRSFDAAKMKSKFNKPKEPTQVSNDCRICGKLVFQMEKIVAEKASWHKNCFRCTECNKNLTLETYQSHEGSLFCKPHFKELFRPKAVIQDEAEERKDRLLRRPRMIILESQPEVLPDDVVRATQKPDYGLEELQTSLNVKERFAVFESYSKAIEEPKLEPVSVRRSQSLMSKAARFSNGHQNGDLEDEEEEYESGEEMEVEEEEEEGGGEEDPNYVKSRKKKERPMSFSGMGDLKAVWEQKQRREEMTQARKEDITKFRQMLCAGKNITLKEMFESGNFEVADDEDKRSREEIKIEDRRAAHNLKARFEKGQPFILEDEEGSEDGSKTSTLVGEKLEVEEVFKDAQTAKQARNVFKQIDSKVCQEGSVILRSPSFAMQNRDNRRSLDISLMMPQRNTSTAEVVKSSEPVEEELQMDTTDLANRFKFFATFEERQKEETEKKRKVFRITPPREGAEQVEETLLTANIKPCMAPNCTVCKLRGLSDGADDSEVLGRDPNLIKCTDNYQDEIDCRNTKNILQMFKKMEMGEEEEEEGPRPLKCFTPPPEDGEGDESEYSDDEYSDEGEEEESEDDEGKPKFKDELLEMEACPQSARKAANLRAKFEKWEVEVERKNELNRDKDGELEEECRPSLDTTRNLKAMFEHKAIEVTKPVTSKPVSQKINRFV